MPDHGEVLSHLGPRKPVFHLSFWWRTERELGTGFRIFRTSIFGFAAFLMRSPT